MPIIEGLSEAQNNPLKRIITSSVCEVIQSWGTPIRAEDLYLFIGEPPSEDLGDYTLSCYPLAKQLRKSPDIIAKQLGECLSSCANFSCKVVGPYVNFSFPIGVLGEQVLTKILNRTLDQQSVFVNPPRVMIEYSQPNTHKELHVGHMRNMALGSALVNLFTNCGIPTLSSTFPGDVGAHVAKCLWYLQYVNKEATPDVKRGEWLGSIYSKAVKALELIEEDLEKKRAADEQISEILRCIEQKQGEAYALWRETRKWSIDLLEEIYHWAGVRFDVWYWESEVDSASVSYVKQLLADGQLMLSNGAVGMDLSDDGLGFCLLLKSDGNGLYATKDVELARRKFEDHKIERSIYIVDSGQSFHLQQIFAVLRRIGFPNAAQCVHLKYEVVELPEGKMSSRRGNIVPIAELITRMQEIVIKDHLDKHRGIWSDVEIEATAKLVARGAIKFGMLRVTNERKIVFDMGEWLRLDGDSGPYLQYACVRLNSLIRKAKEANGNSDAVSWPLLDVAIEREIVVMMSRFNDIVATACKDCQPSIICSYLIRLARKFANYYATTQIIIPTDPALTRARVELMSAVRCILVRGLELLGIDVPERM